MGLDIACVEERDCKDFLRSPVGVFLFAWPVHERFGRFLRRDSLARIPHRTKSVLPRLSAGPDLPGTYITGEHMTH